MIKSKLGVLLIFISGVLSEGENKIDLLLTNSYTWDGKGLGNTEFNVIAENHTIKVTIDTCDIGKSQVRPDESNDEYLILKNGEDGSISTKNGLIFAYIKKPRKIYFYSSSVILQLKSPDLLEKSCKVLFEKADVEETTLPPPTTTESVVTHGPDVSIYSTVLISGHSLEEFNQNKDLLWQLLSSISEMANEYTALEGFCLIDKEGIKPEDIAMETLEQCSAKWPEFDKCVRMVYAIPIKIDDSCSLWTGYQLTQEHLDLMWSRLADKYLKKGFQVYRQNNIDVVIDWWIIAVVITTVIFVIVMIIANVTWKKKQSLKRAHHDDDFMPEMRKTSDESLTPPYFQSIPPMFDKTYDRSRAVNSEETQGADNKGFQYDEIPDCEEEPNV